MYSRRKFLKTQLLAGAIYPTPSFLSNLLGPSEDDLTAIKQKFAENVPVKWLFIGDSITHGALHTYGYRSYPEIFNERVKWEMRRFKDITINTAVSGFTSLDLKDNFNWMAAAFRPEVVFIMIGTNDAADNHALSLSSFKENLEWLITACRSIKAIPLLQTPSSLITAAAPNRSRLVNYIPVIRETSVKMNTVLIDHWEYWESNAVKDEHQDIHQRWFADAIHPNAKGHDEMAKLIFRKLEIFDPKAFTCAPHAF